MPEAVTRHEEVIRSSEKVAGSGSGEVRSGFVPRLNGPPVLVDFEVVNGQAVSGNYYSALGVPATIGRTITFRRFSQELNNKRGK